jgi:D-glucuronyl C5-epimerase C-terminus
MPDYWHPHVQLQTKFLSDPIQLYPISMDVKADYPGQLDDEGVPIVFWGRQKKASPSPVNIALYGLGNYDVFARTGDERYFSKFLHVSRWFEHHSVRLGEGVGWPNDEDIPVFGLRAPWFSGITQGLVLSLFVRAAQAEPTGPWYRLAHDTWLGFHHSVEQGGFCREVENGVIFEEYPGPQLDCVFNGMCFSLIGLWEAWQSGTVREAEDTFSKGVSALRYYLPRFDVKNWSYYSLSECLKGGLLASPYYHRTNALLAQVIGHMSRDPEFTRAGDRWLSTSKSLSRRIYMSLRIGINRYLNDPSLLHSDKSKR